jgi:DNA polymerase II small subunit
MERLLLQGVRVSLDAEQLLKEYEKNDKILDKLINLNKAFLAKEDVELIIAELKKEEQEKAAEAMIPSETEVKRNPDFKAIASEYSADIKINHTRDVTGKSRTTGEVDDFISYFRSRYEKLSKLLRTPSKYPTVNANDARRHVGEKAKIIILVNEVTKTKKGNVMIQGEDMTGQVRAIVSPSNGKEKIFEKAGLILLDDVLAITGKMLEQYMIVDDIEWPDMPITRERKLTENDLASVYLSDIHFGSRYFLEKYFELFTEWIKGRGDRPDLASKVKYVVIAGDIVDGIGIYPNQEKELILKDVGKQYNMFDDFVSRLPDYIEVIIAPGNHDAVRRGEPMPCIGKDLIKSDVTSVGNPCTVTIEGLKHLVYHGTSIDSIIATLPNMSYNHPEKVMLEYLKRRHLSTIYGGNLIIPEKIDYMALEEEPDVLHCGHVHKNGYALYRGTVVINSGTFQDRTEFQVKQGHIPTPAIVPVYEMKTGRLTTLDFKSG